MIKITIEQIVIVRFKKTENFVVKKTPTQYKESSSGYGSDRVVFEEINEPREVEAERKETRTLLNQEIDNEASFDLKSVIAAINGMKNMVP